jgi:hypothetical protein
MVAAGGILDIVMYSLRLMGDRVVEVGPERAGELVELGARIAAHDPLGIPAIRSSVLAGLRGETCFGRYGAMKLFAVERGAEIVGRVAAIVNPRLVDGEGVPLGQVGYFEAIEDSGVATALLDAAVTWVRGRGARVVVGPMNGGAHLPHRLMTKGFDQSAFLFEPRNPPYYPRFFEESGFRPLHAWETFELSVEQVARFQRIASRALASLPQVAFPQPFEPNDSEGLRRIHGVLDRVWAGHVGFAHIDLDEFVEVFGPALALMRKGEFGVVHDGQGHDLGCSFVFPDYAEEVRALAGDGSRWGSWMAGPRPKRLVMHTHAIVPEARRTNAAAIALDWGVRLFRDEGYESLCVALVTEEWGLFRRIAQPTRAYALYGKAIV